IQAERVDESAQPFRVDTEVFDRAAHGRLGTAVPGQIRHHHLVAALGQVANGVPPLDAALASGVDAQHRGTASSDLHVAQRTADLQVPRFDHRSGPSAASFRALSTTTCSTLVNLKYS